MSIVFSYPCGSSTNKGKKPSKISLDTSKVAYAYPELGIVVMKPIIDRLVFGFFPNSKLMKACDGLESDLGEYLNYCAGSVFGDAKANKIKGLSLIEDANFFKEPYKRYNTNLRFQPAGCNAYALIQIGPKSEGKPFAKFDLNPSLFGAKGMAEFWELIDEIFLFMEQPAQATFENFLIWSKALRIDVAVDVLGARPDDMEILKMAGGKPKPSKSCAYKSIKGRIETIYPNTKSGKSDSEYVYNKKKALSDKKKSPMYGDFLHTRYECRAVKQNFFKLNKMKNRCSRVGVRVLDVAKITDDQYVEHLFARDVISRSKAKALEIIPEQHRKQLDDAYEDMMFDIWQPKKIWATWPSVIKQSGILPKECT